MHVGQCRNLYIKSGYLQAEQNQIVFVLVSSFGSLTAILRSLANDDLGKSSASSLTNRSPLSKVDFQEVCGCPNGIQNMLVKCLDSTWAHLVPPNYGLPKIDWRLLLKECECPDFTPTLPRKSFAHTHISFCPGQSQGAMKIWSPTVPQYAHIRRRKWFNLEHLVKPDLLVWLTRNRGKIYVPSQSWYFRLEILLGDKKWSQVNEPSLLVNFNSSLNILAEDYHHL